MNNTYYILHRCVNPTSYTVEVYKRILGLHEIKNDFKTKTDARRWVKANYPGAEEST